MSHANGVESPSPETSGDLLSDLVRHKSEQLIVLAVQFELQVQLEALGVDYPALATWPKSSRGLSSPTELKSQ